MKLQQNQIWRLGEQSIRITRLDRLEVGYKAINDLTPEKGTHHTVTKKEFCRLLKGYTLLPPYAI